MFPDSLIGIVMFVAMLAPGFVYLERRERYHPGLDYSALRETSLVVVTSLASMASVLGAFGLLRIIDRPTLPRALIPDVGGYVGGGESYAQDHFVEGTIWFVILVGLACVVSGLAAVPPEWVARRLNGKAGDWLRDRRGPGVISQASGWGVAFSQRPGSRKFVEIALTNGGGIYGELFSKSSQLEESDDRDIVLVAPIEVRQPGEDQWIGLDKTGTIVISASKIDYFGVQYSNEPTDEAAS